MNNLFLFVLLTITFAFGTVVGETWAPFSGTTTQALSRRCAELELRVAEVEARCAKLEAAVGVASTRFEAWLNQRPAPATEDGGTRIIGL